MVRQDYLLGNITSLNSFFALILISSVKISVFMQLLDAAPVACCANYAE